MVATRKPFLEWPLLLSVAAFVCQFGCTPSGSRALLQGDELLRSGKIGAAIAKFETARNLAPNEPRVWNLLGLAYHRAGKLDLAEQAYRQALAKDRSNVVAVSHFNLGCLLLEQDKAAAAADEFRSFTLATNTAVGLVMLGTAQLHLRQLDAAEKSLAAARQLEPRNLEALNGLGVIHAHRNQRDAAQYFSSALRLNPKYAPALLNAATLARQNPATRSTALQQYRRYLALQPKSPHAENVKLLVQQLESEMVPPRPVILTNVPVQVTLPEKSSVAVVQTTNSLMVTNPPSRATAAGGNSNPPPVLAITNAPIAPATPTRTNQIVKRTEPPLPAPPVPVTIVKLTNEPAPAVAAVAQAVTGSVTRAEDDGPAFPLDVSSTPIASPVEEQKKPGFFARLNPFRGRPRPAVSREAQRIVMVTPKPAPIAATPVAPPAEKPVFPRYAYTSPGPPSAGNRANAERAMQQGTRAARSGNTNEALLNFQLAASTDPAYFDAQYNCALLTMQSGDLNRALAGWERALALEPDSLNARYNFALALKQAGYAYDAGDELEKVIEAKATDVRAHLTLANLCAQQLGNVEKARVHYLKVLELDPRNSQAPAIRFWLAANP